MQRLYVFTKAASSLTGDNATIPNHKDITDQLDYEGELELRSVNMAKRFLKA